MENFGKTAGEYCTGGYGRIGVYRVKDGAQVSNIIPVPVVVVS